MRYSALLLLFWKYTGILANLTLSRSSTLNKINISIGLFAQEFKPTTYTSYQGSLQCTSSWSIQYPTNVQEIQDIVKIAISLGYTVKALGSRHSVHDIICTEGIPISLKNINYTIDNQDGTATFGGGVELFEALSFMEKLNKTFLHVPSFAGITVAGAIGTGAHGSSLRKSSSLSDQVLKLTIVDGKGDIQNIDLESGDLDSFRVHLGLLGIVIDVTFPTVPLYKMLIENTEQPIASLTDGTVMKWAKKYDWFQLWWFPNVNKIVVSKGVYLDVDAPGNASTNLIPNIEPQASELMGNTLEMYQKFRLRSALKIIEQFSADSFHKSVLLKPPIFSENSKTLRNPAVGYGWRLQTNKCHKCAWDNGLLPEEPGIAFDISQFDQVIRMIQNLLANHPTSFPLIGIMIRFSRGGSGDMGITRGRDSFIIEWALPMRKDPYKTPKVGLGTYQAMNQELVFNYGGRPHWGKNGLYYTTQEVLKKSLSPTHRQKFIRTMRKYDPNGLFLNKFGRRILGISDETDRNPKVTRCALLDDCLCRSSNDCGPLQICSKLNGFPVCGDVFDIVWNSLTYVFSRVFRICF